MKSDVVIFGNNDPSTLDYLVGIAATCGAVATVVGVIFAVSRYFGSLGDRRKAQARLVHAVFHGVWPSVYNVGHPLTHGNAEPEPTWPESWVTVTTDGKSWDVSAKVPLARALIKVVNNSDEVVTAIRASVSVNGRLVETSALETVSWLEPKSNEDSLVVWGIWDTENEVENAEPVVVFRDAAGHWWVRHLSQPVAPLSRRQKAKHWEGPDIVWKH